MSQILFNKTYKGLNVGVVPTSGCISQRAAGAVSGILISAFPSGIGNNYRNFMTITESGNVTDGHNIRIQLSGINNTSKYLNFRIHQTEAFNFYNPASQTYLYAVDYYFDGPNIIYDISTAAGYETSWPYMFDSSDIINVQFIDNSYTIPTQNLFVLGNTSPQNINGLGIRAVSGQFISNDLFIQVDSSGTSSGNINLYLYNNPSGSQSIPLYLQNDAASGMVKLYIKGLRPNDTGISNGNNYIPGSGSFNLFISRALTSEPLTLFINNGSDSKNINLYTIGSHIGDSPFLEDTYYWENSNYSGPGSSGYMSFTQGPLDEPRGAFLFNQLSIQYLHTFFGDNFINTAIGKRYSIKLSGTTSHNTYLIQCDNSTNEVSPDILFRPDGTLFPNNIGYYGQTSGYLWFGFNQDEIINVKFYNYQDRMILVIPSTIDSGNSNVKLYTHGF